MKLGSGTIKLILLGIILLWFAGFIRLPFLEITLFSFGGRAFTLHHLLILILIGYAIRLLPGMVQTIVGILLVLWILTTFILPGLGGLANIVILILIVAILFAIF